MTCGAANQLHYLSGRTMRWWCFEPRPEGVSREISCALNENSVLHWPW